MVCRKCLSWLPVAWQKCHADELRGDYCPSTRGTECLNFSLPSPRLQCQALCWRSATTVMGVSPAKNLPRVINWKLQREGGTEWEAVLHVQATKCQTQHSDACRARCKPSCNEFSYMMLLEVALRLVPLGLVMCSTYSLQLALLKIYPNTCPCVLVINILLP